VIGEQRVGPPPDPATGPRLDADPAVVLDMLEAGLLRAATPDVREPTGWRVDPGVRLAILSTFAAGVTADWSVGPLGFRDRAVLAPRSMTGGPWRIVPGGTAIRAGAHLEPGVVVMPPSYINVGAWVGADSMIDSHVLVGSCAQVGARVHLAAGVLLGGVLEPPGARPVIVEDDAFIGAGSTLLDGVLVRRGAVLGAGVTLTGTSRLYDLVDDRILEGTVGAPLEVPELAVVIPGTRPIENGFALAHGLAAATSIIVKRRDARTDARVALEAALR
jgi:2,3,4,5-tetrahydropyridine-2-carboxylate N-succinyltransferase